MVDRVATIDNILFANGYNTFATSKEPVSSLIRRFLNINAPAYVPIDDYNSLVARVAAIESYLLISKAALFKVVDNEWEGNVQALSYAEGEYVTQEEFDKLEEHVEQIEAIVYNEDTKLFIVRADN